MAEYDVVGEQELMALHEAAHLVVAVVHGHKVYATVKEEEFTSVTGEKMKSGGRTAFVGEMSAEELVEVYLSGYMMETVFVTQPAVEALASAKEDMAMVRELEEELHLTTMESYKLEKRAAQRVKKMLSERFVTVRRVAKVLLTEGEVTLTPETLDYV